MKMSKIEFFIQSLGNSFSANLVSPGLKQIHFQGFSSGMCPSVIPRLREKQKAQLVLNFPYITTLFLQKHKAQLFYVDFNQKLQTITRVLLWKSVVLCFGSQLS